MRILLLTAHDVAEYDDLRMLTDLGHDVFSIGAYTDPARSSGTIRPPLPDVPAHPWLAEACEAKRREHEGQPLQAWLEGELHPLVDWAKADLPGEVLEWAEVVICHHYLEPWIGAQWDRLRSKRVIWRTCGQSNARLEEHMRRLHDDGLTIVRYSPQEEVAFTRLGVFAGQDALIRFGKDPADYGPWTGEERVVGNVTQDMAGRGEFCGLSSWLAMARSLPTRPAGLHSERLPNGLGALTYPDMLDYLRRVRTYYYTGTQPASYTLALMEAMLTGVPVVSMRPDAWWMPDLFEMLTPDDPGLLALYLHDEAAAAEASRTIRAHAIELFDIATVAPQWQALLERVPVAA